jgi:hypothetical protein
MPMHLALHLVVKQSQLKDGAVPGLKKVNDYFKIA